MEATATIPSSLPDILSYEGLENLKTSEMKLGLTATDWKVGCYVDILSQYLNQRAVAKI